MKNIALILLLICLCGCSKKRPLRIYQIDKSEVQKKVENESWAQDIYNRLTTKIDVYADRHVNDPEWIVSRLAMYWKEGERYTQCYLKNQNWDRGEGNAPVPTVRMPGMRTWNKYCNVPLEDRTPYNETGDMWGADRTNPELPPVLVPYKESGHMIRGNNVEILTLAEEASFLYWLSGEEKYAKFASDIFYAWLNGTYYMNPILDPDRSTGGPGGYEPGGICGYYDYEQIHDDLALHAAVVYDFLSEYLESNPNPHLKVIGKTLKEVVGIVFKRFIDIGFVRGAKSGNWNVNGWNMMLRPILVLESNEAYEDGKGREYYLHYFTTESTLYHDALPDILQAYDPVTGLWPESPGYAFGTISMLLDMATMLKSSGIDIIADNLVMQKAAMAVFPWMDEQGNMIVFGDSRGGSANFSTFENLLTYYTKVNNEQGIQQAAAALNIGLESGKYHRSKNNWIGLCTYLRSVPQVTDRKNERTSYSPHHEIIVMKNFEDESKFMALLYGGKKGYHLSANGLAMQLYGFGYALAPDAAGYESYWSEDFSYHQTATGCNTVIPGYTTGEIVVNAMEPVVESDCFINTNEINPYISFADVTADEKRRMVTLIRTSPETGYYLDVFRSDLLNNDYLYHNLGTELTLYTKTGTPLNLVSDKVLKNAYSKGYGWFKNPKSISFESDFVAHWNIDAVSPHISMYMWMLGGKGRKIYQVDAPYTTLNSSLTPGGICTPPSSTPTLIVSQNGNNGWKNPFVAVFEPVKGNDKSIVSINSYGSEENFIGLQVESIKERTDYIFNSIDDAIHHPGPEVFFSGNLGIVREKQGKVEMFYLGHGKVIRKGNYSIEAPEKAYASIFRIDGKWFYSSDTEIKVIIAGKEQMLSVGYNQEIKI